MFVHISHISRRTNGNAGFRYKPVSLLFLALDVVSESVCSSSIFPGGLCRGIYGGEKDTALDHAL